MDESLGCYLKRERESRRVSVEDISRATRISKEWILSLEGDGFELCSQPEYIAGFLKLYSTHLGLNHAEVSKRAELEVSRCREQSGRHPSPVPSLAFNSPLRHAGGIALKTFQRSDKMVKRMTLAVFIVLMISLFFFIPSEYKGAKALHSNVSNKLSPPAVASLAAHPEAPDAAKTAASPLMVTDSQRTLTAPAKVIGNRDSRRYHLPGMKYYGQVQAYHRVIFASEAEAKAAGYHKAPR